MGESANTEHDDASAAATGRKRERSLIEFPYSDLDRAIDLCQHTASLAGAGSLDLTQLAAAMDQTATGGTFRGRLAAARTFGLIEFGGNEARLTPLGEEILAPETAAGAKVQAFLRVPLYEKAYAQYQGYALPPAAAIERQMQTWGVPGKQVDRARQAFASSVATAGFVNDKGRFVKPTIGAGNVSTSSENQKSGGSGGGGGGDTGDGPRRSEGSTGGDHANTNSNANSGTSKIPKSHSEMLLELLDPAIMTDEETQAVWTLLLYAKRPKTHGAPKIKENGD